MPFTPLKQRIPSVHHIPLCISSYYFDLINQVLPVGSDQGWGWPCSFLPLYGRNVILQAQQELFGVPMLGWVRIQFYPTFYRLCSNSNGVYVASCGGGCSQSGLFKAKEMFVPLLRTALQSHLYQKVGKDWALRTYPTFRQVRGKGTNVPISWGGLCDCLPTRGCSACPIGTGALENGIRFGP